VTEKPIHALDTATDPLAVSDDRKKRLLPVTHELGEKKNKVLRLRLTDKEERAKEDEDKERCVQTPPDQVRSVARQPRRVCLEEGEPWNARSKQ
jgi:hypothetical protein